jgi:glutaredoxin
VHAVLFYSPTCPHCSHVMEEVLPPLQVVYGDQLQIAEIDVTTSEGLALYDAAVVYFRIPPERRGVPTMVVGDQVLVGSREIPTYLPDLIERGLAEGGVDWPPIPDFVPPAD